jgi:hypothetical protein
MGAGPHTGLLSRTATSDTHTTAWRVSVVAALCLCFICASFVLEFLEHFIQSKKASIFSIGALLKCLQSRHSDKQTLNTIKCLQSRHSDKQTLNTINFCCLF